MPSLPRSLPCGHHLRLHPDLDDVRGLGGEDGHGPSGAPSGDADQEEAQAGVDWGQQIKLAKFSFLQDSFKKVLHCPKVTKEKIFLTLLFLLKKSFAQHPLRPSPLKKSQANNNSHPVVFWKNCFTLSYAPILMAEKAIWR